MQETKNINKIMELRQQDTKLEQTSSDILIGTVQQMPAPAWSTGGVLKKNTLVLIDALNKMHVNQILKVQPVFKLFKPENDKELIRLMSCAKTAAKKFKSNQYRVYLRQAEGAIYIHRIL